jgi:muramidase (phage lysozyme)
MYVHAIMKLKSIWATLQISTIYAEHIRSLEYLTAAVARDTKKHATE